MAKKKKIHYDCLNCSGYCCSYSQIPVNKRSLKRLAKYFEVSEKTARKKFTKPGVADEMVLRHQKDHLFLTICRFFDTDKRRCTIYEGRPDACRTYPGTPRCGFYDFLMIERDRQDDKHMHIAAHIPE
jgi:Fe-S-cluster containining protein